MKNLLLSIFVFFTSFVTLSQSCTHTLHMTDTYGDGWNGNLASVSVNGITVVSNVTLGGGYGPATATFNAPAGATIRVWRSITGSWSYECQIRVTSSTGATVIPLQTLQAGGTTFGGSIGTAQCSGGGGGGGGGTLIPFSGFNTISCGTNTTLYDHGGQFGNYSNYANGYTVLNNGGVATISVSGSTSGESCCDWVRIYNGNGTGGTILGQWQMNSFVSYTSAPGQTLTVQFYSDVSVTGSGIALNVTYSGSCVSAPPPANDLVCNASSISCGQTIGGTTINATNSGTAENGFCTVSQTQPGVWYVVTGNGQQMTANLCGTAWDSRISVFSGPNCSSLTCVGGNDDNGPSCSTNSASYSWISQVGLNYYILVHGYSSTSAFNLQLTCTTPPPPSPTSISASSNPLCSGSSTTLTANGASGTVYWYTGGCGVTQIASGNSITVSPTSTTTYYARNFNGSQFSTSCATTTITVNPSPTISVSSTNNTICAGSSTQLNANGTTQTSGSLTSTFAAGNGCGGGNMFDLVTSGTQVTVNGFSLNPSVTGFQSVNVYYRNGSYSGNETNPGAWTLLGTYNLNGIASTASYMAVSNLVIPPSSTFGIYIQYNANYTTGSGSYSNGILTLNAGVGLCSAFSGTNIPRIFNGIVHYMAGNATSVVWSPSLSLNSSTISNPIASPQTTTTYTATATSNGCSSSASTTITVNPLPTISVTPQSASICNGFSTTLTASGASTYLWNTGQNGQTISVGPNSTQNYSVTGTLNGCSNSATATVTVVPVPIANAGPDKVGITTCGKDTTTLSAISLLQGQQGTWSILSGPNGIISMNTSPNSLFQGVYGGSYVLQWNVTQGGCTGTDQMNVTFNQPNAASLGANIGPSDLLWGGLTSTDWATSTNWYEKQPAGHFVRMSGNVQPTNSSQVFTLNQANGGICIGNTNPTLTTSGDAYDVFVNPGITLNLTNDSLNVFHDIVNNGTLTATNGTVSFVGNHNSSFIGTGTSQLLNMKVNKTAGATVTLNHPVVVTGNLNMIQGNIFTTPTNLLTLGSSSSNSGTLTYNTGTIVGPFKRFFNNLPTNGIEGFFPVGTSTYNRYSDIKFTSSPGIDQSLTVRYNTGAPFVNGTPLYNGLPLTISNSLIQNYSIDGYWEVIPNNGNYSSSINSTPYNVTFFANNLNGMTTPQICRIIKSPGSNHTSWQSCGTHVSIPQNANAQSFLISSNNTQGFSWFNIGTPNSQALPVELLSFDGSCNNNIISLEWKTATEHNSDYFEVVKSRDGENWSSLTTLESAGNSTQELSYETKDHNAIDGNNYYKLIQYDIDGQFEEYGPINVICNGNSKGYFSIFPNPSTGDFQVILNNKRLIGDGTLEVKDSKGSVVYTQEVKISQGINLINVSNINLTSGIYYVSVITDNNSTETLKQVIK